MRKNGLRRALAISMALAMTGGMLAACGSNSGNSSNSGTTGGSTTEASSTADSTSASEGETSTGSATLDTSEEVELVMYVISDRPAGQDIVDEAINKMLKEKLNCTLKINWIGWAEYSNKYPLLFSSGEQFDLAYSATWLNFAALAQKGAFMNLDELWPTYAPENYARAAESAKQQATVNGHYYCVPTLMATYNAYGPMYRTDIMEGTDWDGKMETFEDIEEYCDIVKETHPELEPIDQYSTAPEWYYLYMRNQGYEALSNGIRYIWYDPTEEKPTVHASFEYEDITSEFLTMMARWNEKGFFSKSALSDTDNVKTQNGKAALKNHNIDTYNSLAILHPEWNFQYSNMVKNLAHLPFTQDCMVISNTSANPERAMAFWELLTNDREMFDTLYYGIEGTTYELNDKGEFKIIDSDLYAANAMWAARTTEFNRSQVGSAEDYDSLREGYEAQISEDSPAEKFAGFVFDTSSLETEIANCTNVQQQYWWPLELGYTEAASGLADYQSKMEAGGIDKVLEEAQKQLDAYVESLG